MTTDAFKRERHSYVSFYPSDWLAGMAFMPPLMEWCYLQICLFNWDKRAPVPSTEIAMRLSRHAGWEADLAALIDAGKVQKTAGGGFFVTRALMEAEKSFELWEKKSRGGKSGKPGTNLKNKTAEKQGDDLLSGKSVSKSVESSQSQSLIQSLTSPDGEAPLPPTGEGDDEEDDGANGDLVFSVPPDLWADFRKHRIKLKAPMTERAEKLILKDLEKFHALGHDPTEVLERSIMKGWKGVFAPDNGGRNDQRSNHRSGDGFTDAILDDMAARRGGRAH